MANASHIWTFAALGAALLVYRYWSETRRPEWLDDVLLRTYAKDHVDGSTKDPYVANVALELGLPVSWVEEMSARGVPNDKLERAAAEAVNRMVQAGPPAATSTEALAAYKQTAIDYGVASITAGGS